VVIIYILLRQVALARIVTLIPVWVLGRIPGQSPVPDYRERNKRQNYQTNPFSPAWRRALQDDQTRRQASAVLEAVPVAVAGG